MNKISGAVITYNEENNISRCIQSLQKVCDEILVLDSFSSDNTPTICRNLNVRFYQQEFQGYGLQKIEIAKRCSHKHILSLDADECLSDQLIEEIKNLKKYNMADAYYIPRLTNYCGQWVRHCGWYPDRKIRLWNSTKAFWTQDNVHEVVRVYSSDAKIAFLNSNILHYSFNTAEDHFKKIKKYSDIQAMNLFYAKKIYPSFYKYLASVVKFLEIFFYKLGFLDGKTGLLISYRTAYQQYIKYHKLQLKIERISKL